MKTFTLRINRAASVLRRASGGTLCSRPWSVLALVLMLLFGPSGASADIITTYVFAPGISTVLDGFMESITGGFTFDATDDTESAISLILAGPAPFSGDFTSSGGIGTSYPYGPSVIGYLTLPQPYVPAALVITFDDALSTAPDLISMVNFITCGCVAFYGPASAGAAVVPAPPPCLSPVRPFSSRQWLRWWDS